MHPVSSLVEQIHSRALTAAASYRRAEADLIEILQQAEEHRVFLKRGHSSLFHYVIRELGLSENVTYSLITIARKARVVPELKSRIQSGEITLSNARRIAPLLTPSNQEEWLGKAATLSNRRLEKEIATVQPEAVTPERASYTSADRVRRVQDLLSQARKHAVSLEEALETLMAEYLRRHDPLERAKRQQVRRGFTTPVAPTAESHREDSNANRDSDSDSNTTSSRDAASCVKSVQVVRSTSDHKPEVGKLSQNQGRRTQADQSVSLGKLVTLPVTPRQEGTPVKLQAPSQNPINHQRKPIPAQILHQVNLRDHRRCTYPLPDGKRCGQSRWIEIHHRVPVSAGGTNELENLVTLCSAHHRLQHLNRS